MRAMRVIAAVAAIWGLGMALSAVPATAGQDNTLTVTKVVEGTAPPGTVFTIDVDCEDEGGGIEDFQFEFGPVGGSETVVVQAVEQECNVNESGTGGASSVSYACEVTVPGRGAAQCISDTTLLIPSPGGGATAEFTVTNTFDEQAPAPAPVEAAPVEATPGFTG